MRWLLLLLLVLLLLRLELWLDAWLELWLDAWLEEWLDPWAALAEATVGRTAANAIAAAAMAQDIRRNMNSLLVGFVFGQGHAGPGDGARRKPTARLQKTDRCTSLTLAVMALQHRPMMPASSCISALDATVE